MNRSGSITQSDEKASVGMYYNMYVLIIPTTLVCLLFSTAIPTSLFNFFLLLFVYTHIHIVCTKETTLLWSWYQWSPQYEVPCSMSQNMLTMHVAILIFKSKHYYNTLTYHVWYLYVVKHMCLLLLVELMFSS